METCVARASAAIVQRVPKAAVEEFMQWQRGVTAVMEDFAGYEGTDVYPPSSDKHDEWVTVLHFTDDDSLQKWIDSPIRARWVEKLKTTVGDFDLKTLEGGFSLWFSGVVRESGTSPAGWKMALTVLLGLYPTVMLLSIFVGPYSSKLGFAVSMLVGNALSVSILQWIVMPRLTRLLGPWLNARSDRARQTMGGALGVAAVLAVLAVVFHFVTG